jgi:hypothetical protein
MNSQTVECRLDLLDDHSVSYEDDWHLGKRFKAEVDVDPLRAEMTHWLSTSLSERADFCTGKGLKLLGRHLYELLFPKKVREPFEETFEAFESKVINNQTWRLRLVLTFHPKAERLAALPWEFLYYAKNGGDGTFLSGEKHMLVLTRVVPAQMQGSNGPLRRPLKVLLAVCAPPGRSQGTVKELRKFMDGQHRTGRILLEPTPLEDPTYSQIEKALEEQPDIVHFIGHGEPGSLVMRREPERVTAAQADHDVQRARGVTPTPVERHENVDVSKAEALFANYKPRLVFLQACYGAAVGQNVLYSTALEIMKAGVPAVVAMQFDIGAEEADRFATTFYRDLVEGSTIGAAVYQGRKTLAVKENSAWSHRDFGTPVVYVTKDAEVVVPSGEGFRSGGAWQESGVQGRSCPRCSKNMRHRTCGYCRLKLYCQCKQIRPDVCLCEEELEYPEQGGFCAACEHEFSQPPRHPEAGTAPEPGTPSAPDTPLRPVPQDAWDQAS